MNAEHLCDEVIHIHTYIHTYTCKQLASKGFKTSIDVNAEDLRDEVVSVMSALIAPVSEKPGHMRASNENSEYNYIYIYICAACRVPCVLNKICVCVCLYVHVCIYVNESLYCSIY